MSKSRKSLAIIAGAVVPVLYGASAMAQDVVTPVQYPDGSPPTLPTFWPNHVQSMSQGASATGTDPVIASNFSGGVENVDSNGSPNNGNTPANSVAPLPTPGGTAGVSTSDIGSGQATVLGETFTTTNAFDLGGISIEINSGAGSTMNDASIHLFQLSGVTGASTQYTISGTSVDLLGGGNGAFFTAPSADNIEQFVFTGADQVALAAGTTYAFEIWVDQNSGDDLGIVRTNGNDTNPQPYSGGAAFGILAAGSTTDLGQSDSVYTNGAPNGGVPAAGVARTQISGGQRQMLFAIYSAGAVVTNGTWTGNGDGSTWASAANWNSAGVPGTTPGDTALFSNAVNNANTTELVNLDGNQTLGSLTFNDKGTLYTIAQGTSGTLTLQNATGGAFIDDLIGDPQAGGQIGHTISAPMSIASAGVAISVGQATDTLVLSGAISGSGGVTLQGHSTISLNAGVTMFSGSNSYTGGTAINSGKLIIAQAGSNATFSGSTLVTANTLTALPTGALSVSGSGTVQLADGVTNQTFVTPGANSAVVTSNINLTSLSIAGNGTLDIGNNRIIIDYTTGNDPIASIKTWIANGFADGETAGAQPAIISSDIATDDIASGFSYGIGYADGADGAIAGLPSGEIEIMFTLLGDANLDGTVNSEDFTPFSNNLNSSGRSWDQGDFNYDGTVNSEDFTPFSHDLNQSSSLAASETGTLLSPLISADGLSLANVPEPASVGLMIVAGMGILRRRRRASR